MIASLPLSLLAEDTSTLTWVERNGSFGLVSLIVLAGMAGMVWLFRWLRSDVVPKVFAHLDNERAERERQRVDHAEQLAKRDEICEKAAESNKATAETAARTAQAVADLVQEVRSLKDSRGK